MSFAAFTSGSVNMDGQTQPMSLTGTITSVTPEPSSFALLGTGILGVMRKRLALGKRPNANKPRLRSGLLLWSR